MFYDSFQGATLSKGLNRGLATLLAGALGVGAHYLAQLSGQTWEPILLALFVFLQGKFLQFLPQLTISQSTILKNWMNLHGLFCCSCNINIHEVHPQD